MCKAMNTIKWETNKKVQEVAKIPFKKYINLTEFLDESTKHFKTTINEINKWYFRT